MLSSVLNSGHAVRVNIEIMRAFVRLPLGVRGYPRNHRTSGWPEAPDRILAAARGCLAKDAAGGRSTSYSLRPDIG